MTIVAEQVIVAPPKNSKSCEQESSTTGTSVDRRASRMLWGSLLNRGCAGRATLFSRCPWLPLPLGVVN
jgi:hypothetical protein